LGSGSGWSESADLGRVGSLNFLPSPPSPRIHAPLRMRRCVGGGAGRAAAQGLSGYGLVIASSTEHLLWGDLRQRAVAERWALHPNEDPAIPRRTSRASSPRHWRINGEPHKADHLLAVRVSATSKQEQAAGLSPASRAPSASFSSARSNRPAGRAWGQSPPAVSSPPPPGPAAGPRGSRPTPPCTVANANAAALGAGHGHAKSAQ
jgi:hypothetical protein